MKMRLWAMTLAAMAVLVAAVIPAEAGIQWVGGNDGTQHWGVPGNWHKSRLPESTDEVNIGSTLNLGDAWVLFDASDGTGLTNQCYLGRDYNARLDQSGGTIDVNMWLSICGNPDKYGTYNLSEGRLEIDNQADDYSSLVIGSDLKRGNFLEPAGVVGPGEMNHTGGEIYTRDMCVGTLYDGKYAVAPAADLDVIDDLILGDYSTLELLLSSVVNLDINVGQAATLAGSLVITGLDPNDLTSDVLIMTAAGGVSGSFSSITPGFGVETRSGNTELWLVQIVGQPPTITAQPQPQSVCPGDTATFTVTAQGEGTLSYQWQKDQVDLSDSDPDISGATTDTLQIANTEAADEGDYRCVVSNAFGDTPSDEAALTVEGVTITQQPQPQDACPGETAVFSVSATCAAGYQWQKDSVNLTDGGDISGVLTDTLQIANAEEADEGNYRCVVSNALGDTPSDEAALTVLAECVQSPYDPENPGVPGTPWGIPSYGHIEAENYDMFTLGLGEGKAWHDTTPGNDGMVYRDDDVDIEAATDVTGGYHLSWVRVDEWLEYTVNVEAAGNYDILLRVSNRDDQDGGWFHIEMDGVDVTGSQHFPDTGAYTNWITFTVPDVALSAGEQVLRVWMESEKWQFNWMRLLAVEGPPTILADPEPQSECVGFTAVFTVEAIAAEGTGTLTYQWQKDQVNLSDADPDISGATTDALHVANVEAADAGDYRCIVSNDYGGTTSNEAALTVLAECPQSPYQRETPWPLPGRIEAEDYDEGGEGIAYHDTDPYNDGHLYRDDEAVDIYLAGEEEGGGFSVGRPRPDEWLEYTVVLSSSGQYEFRVRVACLSEGGEFHLEMNRVDVTGPVTVPVTGSYDYYETVAIPDVTLQEGEQILRLVVHTGTWNVNWIGIPGIFCNSPFADADDDGDVDQDDFANFQRCYTGTGPGSQIPEDDPYCACFDTDLDEKVSEVDYLEFEEYATGPGVKPD